METIRPSSRRRLAALLGASVAASLSPAQARPMFPPYVYTGPGAHAPLPRSPALTGTGWMTYSAATQTTGTNAFRILDAAQKLIAESPEQTPRIAALRHAFCKQEAITNCGDSVVTSGLEPAKDEVLATTLVLFGRLADERFIDPPTQAALRAAQQTAVHSTDLRNGIERLMPHQERHPASHAP